MISHSPALAADSESLLPALAVMAHKARSSHEGAAGERAPAAPAAPTVKVQAEEKAKVQAEKVQTVEEKIRAPAAEERPALEARVRSCRRVLPAALQQAASSGWAALFVEKPVHNR